MLFAFLQNDKSRFISVRGNFRLDVQLSKLRGKVKLRRKQLQQTNPMIHKSKHNDPVRMYGFGHGRNFEQCIQMQSFDSF